MIQTHHVSRNRCPQEANGLDLRFSRSTAVLRPQWSDENVLAIEKDFNKLTKSHKELKDKYEKMKDFAIGEKVNLEMRLHEKENQIINLKEEKGMLMSRINFLEKELQTAKKAKERDLSRSLIKSVYNLKNQGVEEGPYLGRSVRAIPPKQNKMKQTKTSLFGGKQNQNKVKNQNILNKSQNQLKESVCSIKFDIKQKNEKPLIVEDQKQCQEVSHPCGNKKCIQNYEKLQQLRGILFHVGEIMETIYLQLQSKFNRKYGLKEKTEYVQNMLKLLSLSEESNFFYKQKPLLLINKIQEKFDRILTNPNKNYQRPLMAEMERKFSQFKQQEKQFNQIHIHESYDQKQSQEFLKKIIDEREKNEKKIYSLFFKGEQKNEKNQRIVENFDLENMEISR